MKKNKYLVIDNQILPDVYEKVVRTKDLIVTGKAKDVTEAVKLTGISRSTFYKYKDYVFTLAEGIKGHKVTISLMLSHMPGILSIILNRIAQYHGNVLTIYQAIPINKVANVNITFDISDLDVEFDALIDDLRDIEGVIKVDLVTME